MELSAEKQQTNDLKLLANNIKQGQMNTDHEKINNEIYYQQNKINELTNQLETNNQLLKHKQDEIDKLKENKVIIKVIHLIFFPFISKRDRIDLWNCNSFQFTDYFYILGFDRV